MGLVIVIGNTRKGGVGKSTVLTNIVIDLLRSRPDLNILK